MSLVSWKFDFGAYGIDSGKVKCLADDSVRWRLFTRKEHSGNAWSVEWFGGTKSLSDIRGASFIILTAMFPNHDPRLGAPKLLVEEKNACHVFKVTVQLKRKTHTVDKANDFSVAAMNNDLGTMEQMLQKDYNPEDLKELNSEGDTALHVAFRCRSDDAGVYMLKKCPELRNYKNRFNEEPLDIASKKMQRLANYRFTDTEVQVSDYEKQSVGYNLRNDRDFGDDAIGHKIYAKSLANALYSSKLQTPLTVGLFAPWGSGKTFLLKLLLKILKGMQKKYNKTKSTCWNEFKLFLHIVFFLPPPPTYFEETDEMDFIIVNFNAWEYAGSDSLWAGIVTNLVSKIETYAGYWKTRFFRIVAKPKEVAKVPPTKQNKAANLKLRKTTLIVKLPNFVWLGLFLLLLVAAIVLAVLIATGELRVEYPSNSTGNATDEVQSSEGSAKDTLIAIQACITSVLGGTVFLNIKSIGKGIMTFVNSQKDKIEKMVNKPDFSSKLGFMSEIKNEVVIASALINWISSYKKKPIRVIITVDDLDRCPKKKAVKVIEAMNILLSDEFSPFICILAVDSRIIVEAIEESLGKVAMNAYLTGHEYLKKFLQVPFCIPAMSLSSKEKFMRKLKEEASSSNDDNEDDFYGIGWQDRETEEPEKATKYSCCCNAKVEDDDKIQLKVESQFNYELNKDDSYMEDLLKEFARNRNITIPCWKPTTHQANL
uniref:Uncharacterized protein LOC102802714 n=1 Tax=Saccoglossus kowalevskii TaxID=10224 RepID=A0ABM0MCE1_SACKO|nr:PREDICTED: uncharacterized protein LOC102802714 [Saccoglossus kowalevskii]